MNSIIAIDIVTLLFSAAIIALTFLVAYLFRRFFNRFILNSTRLVKNDPTNYKFLKHVLSSIIYVVGFSMAIYRIEALQVLASSMLAGAGILAVAVGFASQAALSNVISGLFLIIFKPYRINDRVTIRDNLRGIVEDITLRHTVIRDFENRRIIIPNTVMSDEVIVNADMGEEKVCRFVEVGISYDSDIAKARQIMQEEAMKHPLHIDNRKPEQIEEGMDEISVRLISFGDSSVNLRAWVWAANQADGFTMHCELLESIKARFDAEGIEIPFPYRTLVFKNSLTPDKKEEAEPEHL
ncbi:MAG: mechanosensitive ion channel family protein [Saprospiraceae bacterium]